MKEKKHRARIILIILSCNYIYEEELRANHKTYELKCQNTACHITSHVLSCHNIPCRSHVLSCHTTSCQDAFQTAVRCLGYRNQEAGGGRRQKNFPPLTTKGEPKIKEKLFQDKTRSETYIPYKWEKKT